MSDTTDKNGCELDVTSLAVNTGPQGTIGHTGAKGDQGFQGDQGYTGARGTQGIRGDQGEQGLPGLPADDAAAPISTGIYFMAGYVSILNNNDLKVPSGEGVIAKLGAGADSEPYYITVNWIAQTLIDLPVPTTGLSYLDVYIDESAQVIVEFRDTDKRDDMIHLGSIESLDGTLIKYHSTPSFARGAPELIKDLVQFRNRKKGGEVTEFAPFGVGAPKHLIVEEITIFGEGFEETPQFSPIDDPGPGTKTFARREPAEFTKILGTTELIDPITTALPFDTFDGGLPGTPSLIPTGGAAFHYLLMSQNGDLFLSYGQQTYTSKGDAEYKSRADLANHRMPEELLRNGYLLAQILVDTKGFYAILSYDWESAFYNAAPSEEQFVHVADTPPSDPRQGDLWLDSTIGVLSIYYVDQDSSQWIAIADSATGYNFMRGWFDPTANGGGVGTTVPYTVIDGSVEWRQNEYIIASTDGQYNLSTGLTDITSPLIRRGSRLRYNGTIWEEVNDNSTRMKGWFDPVQAGGGPDVDYSIQDNLPVAERGDYVIASSSGNYNFGVGLPDLAGESIVAGNRVIYDGALWKELQPSSLFAGWFDPTRIGGDLLYPLENSSGNYSVDQYVIAEVDGHYNFATGLPDPAEPFIPLGSRWKFDGFFWIRVDVGSDTMRGWLEPNLPQGGPKVPYPIIDGSTEYVDGDYILVETGGQYNFTTGQPDAAMPVTKEGSRIKYDGANWIPVNFISGRMKGWFDSTQALGGWPDIDVINGSPDAAMGDYVIVVTPGIYNFNTGQPDPSASPILYGSRLIYDGFIWFENVAASLLIDWFDPTVAGGGIVPPIVDGTVDYVEDQYIIATSAGQYNFTTGIPDITGVIVQEGDRFIYIGGIWTILGIPRSANRGWFDPTIDCGGTFVPACVIDNDPTGIYKNNDYCIASQGGFYNFRLGTTDPAIIEVDTIEIGVGDRVAYDGTNWIVIAASVGLMKGWFDPNAAAGGAWVENPVVNGTALFNVREYVIASEQGNYDFGSGAPTPTGVPIEKGDLFVYNGTNFVQQPVDYGRMRGFMDASASNGGTDVPWNVVNASTHYQAGEYVIVRIPGVYSLTTGLVDPLGEDLQEGDRLIYDGTLWDVLNVTEPLIQGWFNPTLAGGGLPDDIVNATTKYIADEYVIVDTDGIYNYALGAPDIAGEVLKVGDRVKYDGTTWAKLPVYETIVYNRGWFNPNIANGGPNVQFPVLDGSLDYIALDYVTVELHGFYDFATGLPDVTGIEVFKGDHVRFNGTVWERMDRTLKDYMRGWMDPTQTGGGADVLFPVLHSTTFYKRNDYVIVKGKGRYDLGIGDVSTTGTPLEPGDKLVFDGAIFGLADRTKDLLRGYFDPNIDTGIGGVPWDVIDGSTEYIVDETIIAISDGFYNFALGLTDPLAEEVTQGDIYRYTGTIWVKMNPPIPNPILDWAGLTEYEVGDYIRYVPGMELYRCAVAHTSTADFIVDLATLAWEPLSGYLRTGTVLEGVPVVQVLKEQVLYQNLGLARAPIHDDEIVPKWYVDNSGGNELSTEESLLPTISAIGFRLRIATLPPVCSGTLMIAWEKGDSTHWAATVAFANRAAAAGGLLQTLNTIAGDAGWSSIQLVEDAGAVHVELVSSGLWNFAGGSYFTVSTVSAASSIGSVPQNEKPQLYTPIEAVTGTVLLSEFDRLDPGSITAITESVVEDIIQAGHGFLFGHNIRKDALNTWVLAQADLIDNLKMGMVSEVIDANTFTVTYYGIVRAPAHGFGVASTYFLDQVNPGLHVANQPPTGFAQATFEVIDADVVKVLDQAVVLS